MTEPVVSIVSGAATRELRRQVLRPHQDASEPLPGDDAADAVHFAIFDEHGPAPLCACFVFVEDYPWPKAPGSPPEDRPLWHLRSVATDSAHQRRGLGTVLIRAVLDFVARYGGGVVWCNARTPAVPFYLRLGLATYGDEHISNGLPHFYMWCPVEPAAPDADRQPLPIRLSENDSVTLPDGTAFGSTYTPLDAGHSGD